MDKKTKDIIKEETEKVIAESSLSRIWSFIESPEGTFGVISAYRADEFTPEENKERHAKLITEVKALRLGYILLRGGYPENGVFTEELSLFIIGIKKKEIIALGAEYNQDSILFKDNIEFVSIGTNKRFGIGTIIDTFKKSAGKENLSLSSSDFEYGYSKLMYGKHQNKKFQFNINEGKISLSVASYLDSKEIYETWVKLF